MSAIVEMQYGCEPNPFGLDAKRFQYGMVGCGCACYQAAPRCQPHATCLTLTELEATTSFGLSGLLTLNNA